MNVNKLKKTLSVLLIAAFMLSAAGCSMIDYKKAEKLKNDGDYAAAQEMYIALGDYKDSAELANECGYQLAKAAYDSEDYETAAGLFDKLGSSVQSSSTNGCPAAWISQMSCRLFLTRSPGTWMLPHWPPTAISITVSSCSRPSSLTAEHSFWAMIPPPLSIRFLLLSRTVSR